MPTTATPHVAVTWHGENQILHQSPSTAKKAGPDWVCDVRQRSTLHHKHRRHHAGTQDIRSSPGAADAESSSLCHCAASHQSHLSISVQIWWVASLLCRVYFLLFWLVFQLTKYHEWMRMWDFLPLASDVRKYCVFFISCTLKKYIKKSIWDVSTTKMLNIKVLIWTIWMPQNDGFDEKIPEYVNFWKKSFFSCLNDLKINYTDIEIYIWYDIKSKNNRIITPFWILLDSLLNLRSIKIARSIIKLIFLKSIDTYYMYIIIGDVAS